MQDANYCKNGFARNDARRAASQRENPEDAATSLAKKVFGAL